MFDGPEESLKSPSHLPWLDGVALRDLVLHETHAACVDARGDVYQWGNVSAQGSPAARPIRTLRGKVRIRLDFLLLDNWGPLIVIHPEHQTIVDQWGQTRGFIADGSYLCVARHECPAGSLSKWY